MKRNLKFFTLAAPVLFFAFPFVSCESHEPKSDAFEKVKEAKLASSEKKTQAKGIISDPAKTETEIPSAILPKNEIRVEWDNFKTEMENKFLGNETKIRQIKSKANTNTKQLKQVAGLEKENNDLRRQMDEYNEEVKARWETFKVKMNHDANEIGIELKDITVNSKK